MKAAFSGIGVHKAMKVFVNYVAYAPLAVANLATVPRYLRVKGTGLLRQILAKVLRQYEIISNHYSEFKLLQERLTLSLEKYAACKAQPRTVAAYNSLITLLRREILSLCGTSPACQNLQVFLALMSDWVKKAMEVMDFQAAFTERVAPQSHLANSPQTTTTPTITQYEATMIDACADQNNTALSEDELDVLQPGDFPYNGLHPIPLPIHRDTLEYLYKRVKTKNGQAKQAASVRLAEKEISSLTKVMEIDILKCIFDDSKKSESPPSAQDVEAEYVKRVQSKYTDCGIFEKFLLKIKKFHHRHLRLRKRVQKVATSFCMPSGSHNVSNGLRGKTSSISTVSTSHCGELQIVLRDIISCMHNKVRDSKNNGQGFFRPEQIDEMAMEIEESAYQELIKILEICLMSHDEQIARYVSFGTASIKKLKDIDFFICTDQEYLGLLPQS